MRSVRKRGAGTNLLLMLLILLIGSVGVSYARWTEDLSISGSVSMGNIDVGFLSLSLVPEGLEEEAPIGADIVNDGKGIVINMAGAAPGSSKQIEFEVENKGTVPVTYQVSALMDAGVVQVISGDETLGVDGIGKGMIIICIPEDAEEGTVYMFSFELTFQQIDVVELQ